MAKGKQDAAVMIPCKVALGMFSDERVVVVELPDNRKICAIVDEGRVKVDRDPRPGEQVDGWVEVAPVKIAKDSCVVDLPQPSLTQGARVRVPTRLLVGAAS
ncbi:hypothetical protein FJY63_00355 [Candidatus Sumerlaeota bacterium]|nr:hypothetical protein [Candidatus Sumerlaeota bacterium]